MLPKHRAVGGGGGRSTMLEASEYTSGYHKITAKSVVSQTSRDSMQQTSLNGISTSRDAF